MPNDFPTHDFDFWSLDPDFLTQRHRLTYAQLSLLGLKISDRDKVLKEKIIALSTYQKSQEALKQILDCHIDFLLIKGFELSQRIYSDPTIRFSWDLDILVLNQNDISFLRNQLLDLGWKEEESNWPLDRQRLEWYMNLTYQMSMSHPNGTLVEIHWNLDNHFFNLGIPKKRKLLDSNISEMKFQNLSFKVMSPELELVYLIIHGARHAWFRLKWLVDIFHFPLEELDLEKFERLSQEFEMDHLIPHVKGLIHDIFKKTWALGLLYEENNSFLFNYSIKRISGEELSPTPSLKEFFTLLIHNSFIIKKPQGIIKMWFNTIGVRPNDIKEVGYRFYWMYFFHRYLSLIRRKF